MTDFEYVGTELAVFKHATNWKSYYGRLMAPFLGSEVLEVGAGIGANTAHFCRADHKRWVCLEPDQAMAREIGALIAAGKLPRCCAVASGTTQTLPCGGQFDSLIYVDVLEHIEDDAAEVQRALGLLRPGGYLVVLSPAHQFLFSPFDAKIGHFRRYGRKDLLRLVPAKLVSLRYLDAAGMLLSLGNRLLLQQAMPTLRQIQFWDKRVVPVSKVLDPLLGFRVGKSILGIWEKQR